MDVVVVAGMVVHTDDFVTVLKEVFDTPLH
jgi:hypothetical protein